MFSSLTLRYYSYNQIKTLTINTNHPHMVCQYQDFGCTKFFMPSIISEIPWSLLYYTLSMFAYHLIPFCWHKTPEWVHLWDTSLRQTLWSLFHDLSVVPIPLTPSSCRWYLLPRILPSWWEMNFFFSMLPLPEVLILLVSSILIYLATQLFTLVRLHLSNMGELTVPYHPDPPWHFILNLSWYYLLLRLQLLEPFLLLTFTTVSFWLLCHIIPILSGTLPTYLSIWVLSLMFHWTTWVPTACSLLLIAEQLLLLISLTGSLSTMFPATLSVFFLHYKSTLSKGIMSTTSLWEASVTCWISTVNWKQATTAGSLTDLFETATQHCQMFLLHYTIGWLSLQWADNHLYLWCTLLPLEASVTYWIHNVISYLFILLYNVLCYFNNIPSTAPSWSMHPAPTLLQDIIFQLHLVVDCSSLIIYIATSYIGNLWLLEFYLLMLSTNKMMDLLAMSRDELLSTSLLVFTLFLLYSGMPCSLCLPYGLLCWLCLPSGAINFST